MGKAKHLFLDTFKLLTSEGNRTVLIDILGEVKKITNVCFKFYLEMAENMINYTNPSIDPLPSDFALLLYLSV